MVSHAEAIISPDNRGTACRAAGRNMWAAFAVLFTVTSFGRKPVAEGRRGCKGARSTRGVDG